MFLQDNKWIKRCSCCKEIKDIIFLVVVKIEQIVLMIVAKFVFLKRVKFGIIKIKKKNQTNKRI